MLLDFKLFSQNIWLFSNTKSNLFISHPRPKKTHYQYSFHPNHSTSYLVQNHVTIVITTTIAYHHPTVSPLSFHSHNNDLTTFNFKILILILFIIINYIKNIFLNIKTNNLTLNRKKILKTKTNNLIFNIIKLTYI